MTGLGQVRAAVGELLARPPRIVDSAERADRVVWEQIAGDCTALGELDAELAGQHGAVGLASALWMAAAQLDTPEHDELRRVTVGDPYAAAMALLAQGPRIRQMLTDLDTAAGRRDGRRAHREHARAVERLRQAVDAAEQDAGGDPDGEVSRPRTVDVQRAVADSAATQADLAAAEAGGGEPGGDVMVVRAAAAEEQLTADATAATGWGSEPVELQRMDPDERIALARLAELIGRFRQMAAAQRSRRVEHAKGEYVGVTLGDELTGLVPDELVALAVPALRAQWAIRYADRQLQIYDQRGVEHEAQGSIIAVVDCSSSMNNYDYSAGPTVTGEAYAKALALALLDQARAAIPFSEVPHDPYQVPADQPADLARKGEVAGFFPGGGTEFAPALDAEYNTTGRARADIVIITDGSAELDDTWVDAWRERRRRLGFRVFAVTIGDWAEDPEELHRICDDVRAVTDLADTHTTADLFRTI